MTDDGPGHRPARGRGDPDPAAPPRAEAAVPATGRAGATSNGRTPPPPAAPGPARPSWTFLTNHGHVLLTVARDPDVRVTDVAARVGITPRAALLILRDLEDAGYLRRERVRTHYTIEEHRPFRHPATATHEVDDLIAIFTDDEQTATENAATDAT